MRKSATSSSPPIAKTTKPRFISLAKDALIYSSPRRKRPEGKRAYGSSALGVPGSSSLFFLDSRVRGNDIFAFNQRLPNRCFVFGGNCRRGDRHLIGTYGNSPVRPSRVIRLASPNRPLIRNSTRKRLFRHAGRTEFIPANALNLNARVLLSDLILL